MPTLRLLLELDEDEDEDEDELVDELDDPLFPELPHAAIVSAVADTTAATFIA
jgi:hypothetical protein